MDAGLEPGRLRGKNRSMSHTSAILLALAAVTLGSYGCHVPVTPRSLPDLAAVTVEHYRRNLCSTAPPRPCRDDNDCADGICVSVLSTDAGAFGRDGGHTVAVGDRVLWQFGDTFTDAGMLSSTAAWSDNRDPLSAHDAVGEHGEPVALLPFTAAEIRFNAEHATPPACCTNVAECDGVAYCHCPPGTDCTTRLALWPGDGLKTSPDVATVYLDRQLVGTAPYDFAPAGVGLARIRRGDASAERLLTADGDALQLFAPDEPHFARGLRVEDSDTAYFYLYASVGRVGCAVDVLLARVPVTSLDKRSSYRFWDGRNWSADLEAARPVARQIRGGLGSVAWNEHLRAYLSVWSDICTGGSQLALRWAPQPHGPWSEAHDVDLRAFGAGPDAYYGMQHVEFGNDRELLVSYFQPVGVVDGQIRLLRLTLP